MCVCVCVCVCVLGCVHNPMSRGCEKYYVIYDSRTYNIKTTIVPIHGDHIKSSMRIEAILSVDATPRPHPPQRVHSPLVVEVKGHSHWIQ